MIHLLCALDCEAKPVLEAFQLRRVPECKVAKVYITPNQSLSLTVTGTGKLAMASAVGYLAAFLPVSSKDGWLNYGIAGHPDFDIGSAWLVNKISDEAGSKTWFPQILFDSPLPRTSLVTVDKPVFNYGEAVLYDMEAAGFYDCISRITTAEMAHCLKIVSDNRLAPAGKINKQLVLDLISANLDTLEHVMDRLSELSKLIISDDAVDNMYKQFIEHWHFTRTEQVQLKHLLNRWQILLPEQPPLTGIQGTVNTGKQVLLTLRDRLDNVPIKLGS